MPLHLPKQNGVPILEGLKGAKGGEREGRERGRGRERESAREKEGQRRKDGEEGGRERERSKAPVSVFAPCSCKSSLGTKEAEGKGKQPFSLFSLCNLHKC